ncbi:hypothetical protein [Bradyrhizobium sp. Arg816]|uniref:hypothetical protein n=1 Tax=Bradyrhizobium sp. Arg816 TaxID=2998491 RepID=UPI00249E2A72|nr:hypothetical protein [Bradyrhizobium sp. Arg816]MDI3567218.1 hypothetical protein [Bradyrhizobium sp. Arg816]
MAQRVVPEAAKEGLTMEPLGKSEIYLLAISAMVVIVACVGAFSVWDAMGVEIGKHGWITLGLGAFFSLLVGCCLMVPMFLSSPSGHDDRDGP